MKEFPSKILEEAVSAFASLPGVGRKSAFRMTLALLRQGHEQTQRFIDALTDLNDNIQYCTVCHNISDRPVCDICANPHRDHATVCVVESIKEMMLIESTGQYNGVYHVLGGLISPMMGVTPAGLTINALADRLREGTVREVILALSPNVEGDTTAFYIYRKIKDLGITITTLAQGVAVGDDLEYTDEATLSRAIEMRQTYNDK